MGLSSFMRRGSTGTTPRMVMIKISVGDCQKRSQMKKPERCSIQFCDLVLFSNIQEAMQRDIVQKSLLPHLETITPLSTNVHDIPTRISFQRVLTMATDVYKLEWTR